MLAQTEVIPTEADLVSRARALLPLISERAAEAEKNRRIPDETIQALQEAGFFRILQPKQWGGYEMHPNTFYKVQMTLAEACMSTAWVYGVVGVHPFQLALFDQRAQREVWGENDTVLVSSSYQPVGKVTRDGDGFRLSGHWSFSSGCEHCDWVLLGSIIPPEQSPSGELDMRTFLLPKQDYSIGDAWHVFGLRGTGSQDIVVDDVFVPDYRTHRGIDGFNCDNPGNKVNTAPLYRIPWAQIFVRSVSTSAIGATQGALNAYLDIAKKRVSSIDGKATAQDPVAQTVAAEAEATLDGLRSVLFNNMDNLVDAVNEQLEIPIEQRVRYRYDSATVVQKCIDVVDEMQHNLGGRGIYESSPVVRHFLDLHAGRAHVANTSHKLASNLGAVRLGLDNQDFFI